MSKWQLLQNFLVALGLIGLIHAVVFALNIAEPTKPKPPPPRQWATYSYSISESRIVDYAITWSEDVKEWRIPYPVDSGFKGVCRIYQDENGVWQVDGHAGIALQGLCESLAALRDKPCP